VKQKLANELASSFLVYDKIGDAFIELESKEVQGLIPSSGSPLNIRPVATDARQGDSQLL
jgi:hypothetical protein